MEQLEETKRELEARIAEEKLAKPKVTEEFIRFWLLRFRKLDMSLKDQRQALVDTFINAIYLYDDKVLITFNYNCLLYTSNKSLGAFGGLHNDCVRQQVCCSTRSKEKMCIRDRCRQGAAAALCCKATFVKRRV